MVNLFTDNTSLFLVISESITTPKQLIKDLSKISQRAYQWKMLTLAPQKQSQEMYFS